MKTKNNRKCIVCGKEYKFCNSCGEFDNLPRWNAIYHDENCKEVFETASDYLAEDITKEEAKERFDKCDLSNKVNFHSAIIKAINEVYDIKEEKKAEKKYFAKKEVEKENIDSINSEK